MFGKKLMRKSLGVMVVLVLVLSVFVTAVSALNGTAVINPIESNLAAKYWVTASSDSGAATAAAAVDENMLTGWVADDQVAGHWLMLDLAGAYDNLRKVEVVFHDQNVVYQYLVEASADGSAWDVIVDRTANASMSEGFVDLFTRPDTRYLRLTITGATPGAIMGIQEFKVFNYLRENIVNGADMSDMDSQNRSYYVYPNQPGNMGAGPNALDVIQDRGMKFVRLRVWNEPRSETSGNPSTAPSAAAPYVGPDRTALVATAVESRGLQLGIDFHYADSWADPGKQPKPKAWAELPFDDLVVAMHDFTYDYISRLVDQGTTPDKVAVGNEIINGFLWGSETLEMGLGTINPAYVRNNPGIYLSQPGGGLLWKYWGSNDPVEQQKYDEAWDRFSTLVAAGIKGVREASPTTAVEIHVIVDTGKLAKTMEFWDQLLTRVNAKGADPDYLAISYYPEWHGTFQNLEENLHTMATTYPGYKLEIAETSYPATGGSTPKPNADQPRTIQGQANMIQRTIQTANDVIDNRGTGVLVWQPLTWDTMFARYSGSIYQPNASIDVFNKSYAKNILENHVYLTTFKMEAPALPEAVNMLTTSDSSVTAVPVEWNAVDPASYENPGSFTVTGTTEYGEVTAYVSVIYHFTGFTPPVESLPGLNPAEAGKAAPVKFSLTGDQGLSILADGYPVTQEINCDTSGALSPFGTTVTAGSSSLTYDPEFDQYIYVLKTKKAWAGTCRQLVVQFTDGMQYRANFEFK